MTVPLVLLMNFIGLLNIIAMGCCESKTQPRRYVYNPVANPIRSRSPQPEQGISVNPYNHNPQNSYHQSYPQSIHQQSPPKINPYGITSNTLINNQYHQPSFPNSQPHPPNNLPHYNSLPQQQPQWQQQITFDPNAIGTGLAKIIQESNAKQSQRLFNNLPPP